MDTQGLPPKVTAALYAGAGVLFIAGAFHGGRPGFSVVGLAFVALGAMIYLRQKRKPD